MLAYFPLSTNVVGLMVWREILSNEFPPRVVPLILSLNGWLERGVMLAVKWTSLSFCRVTSLIRAPSAVMSSRRTELVSIFSDPATVKTILFNFPVRNLMYVELRRSILTHANTGYLLSRCSQILFISAPINSNKRNNNNWSSIMFITYLSQDWR